MSDSIHDLDTSAAAQSTLDAAVWCFKYDFGDFERWLTSRPRTPAELIAITNHLKNKGLLK